MSQSNKEFVSTWIIENFSFFDKEFWSGIDSPSFVAKHIDSSKWKLNICYGNYGSISLTLCRLNEENNKKSLTLQIEVCNLENEVLHTTEKTGITIHAGERYTFSKVPFEELNNVLKDDFRDTLILRCRMCATSEKETVEGPLSTSCTMKTTIFLDTSSYLRTVNYSESTKWSSTFSFPVNELVSMNVNMKNHQDDILFEITLKGKKSRKIKCEIALLNYDRTEKVSGKGSFTFSPNCQTWYLPSFLKKSSLKNGTSSLGFKFDFALSNGLFQYWSVVDYDQETKNLDLTSLPEDIKNTPSTNSLTDDLRQMLFSKEHADVSFNADGEVISAHKNILAFRSPVFSAMFNQPMTESETGVVHISDMDVQTLKLFLEFLYTGDLRELDWGRMLELLLAAEKYQVPSLKEKCSKFLIRCFSLDNVCDIVSVADIAGDLTLKMSSIEYIKQNISEVLSSSKWLMLTDKNVKLCSEIFRKFSEDLKAKQVKT